MYLTFKLLHLVGVFMFLAGICGTVMISYFTKGASRPKELTFTRVFYVAGMLLIVGSGLKTLSEMGLMSGGIPLWAKLKLGIVVIAIPGLILGNLRGSWFRVLISLYVVLGTAAGALALFKPV